MKDALVEHGDIALSSAYFQQLRLPTTARILDVGTRFGSFPDALRKLGFREVFGIEIGQKNLHLGLSTYPHLRGRLLIYDGKTLPFPSGTFDAVTMFDVLEHIPDLSDYAQEVLRILRPGGFLIFQTPNRYVNIPWEILQHRSLTRWREFHCSLQSLWSLRSLLIRSGFESTCIERFNMPSRYKERHVRRKLGRFGPALLFLARQLPTFLSPNFWGHARKPRS